MGGFDIFRSIRLDNTTWKTPENIGYPVNTTDDDKFFEPVNDGIHAYYSMSTDYKKKEIFYLGIGVSALELQYEIQGYYSLSDTARPLNENDKIYLTNKISCDTADIGIPNKHTGLYSFLVNPGNYRILYTGQGYLAQTIDTSIIKDNPTMVVNLNVRLEKDPNYQVIYDKINLTDIPAVEAIDSSILIKNMKVNDVGDSNINDSDILYYTVQVMALYNPVDITYFKFISDMRVMYNDLDKFYRYTTGRFATRQEAIARRSELLSKGYPEEIFIKKVSK
jgi:hypothetical protein